MTTPSSKVRNTLVALGVAAAVIPAAVSDAKTHETHGGKAPKSHEAKPHEAHAVAYLFKGTFNAGKVTVTNGNKHVRRAGFVGTDVSFDFSAARVKVADANGDGTRDMADVADGDKVVVLARLARKDPGAGPFAAKRLVDKTHAKKAHAEDSDEDGEQEQPATATETETETD